MRNISVIASMIIASLTLLLSDCDSALSNPDGFGTRVHTFQCEPDREYDLR